MVFVGHMAEENGAQLTDAVKQRMTAQEICALITFSCIKFAPKQPQRENHEQKKEKMCLNYDDMILWFSFFNLIS
jgi:hypothetical protein